ncbi:MAG: DUF1684 domain-containing protein [Cellulomonadaceae bacterium]|nr:DUF1684 domain-containing protein [Cellulomonadaceae bacterium]
MTGTTAAPTTDFLTGWQAWHDAREARFREPYGWTSVTALHWLEDAPSRLDDLPGLWSWTGEVARVESRAVDGLALVDGPLVDGVLEIGLAALAAGVSLTVGERRLEVASRGGRAIVRVRDPRSEHRAAFAGIETFAPDERWVVPARFEPFDATTVVTTGSVVEGVDVEHAAVGTLHAELEGIPVSLVVFATATGPGWILFRDATSGLTTYPGARFVTLGEVGPDGAVELDLNRASNLPCAVTSFATCPVPPAQNTIPVPVEAGERWTR